eukprot:2602354-Alexandrium_andersonii.AAC.1
MVRGWAVARGRPKAPLSTIARSLRRHIGVAGRVIARTRAVIRPEQEQEQQKQESLSNGPRRMFEARVSGRFRAKVRMSA